MKRAVSIVGMLFVTLALALGLSTTASAAGPTDGHNKNNRWYCNSAKSVKGHTVGVVTPASNNDNNTVVLDPGECVSTGSVDPSLISAYGPSYRISYGHGYGKCKKGAAWWNPAKKRDFIVIKIYSKSKCKNP